MAGADAQGVEHQGGGPRGVQWAEEPRHAPGGDSEDGTAARVQVSRAGPRFLRKAISEKVGRLKLLQARAPREGNGNLCYRYKTL